MIFPNGLRPGAAFACWLAMVVGVALSTAEAAVLVELNQPAVIDSLAVDQPGAVNQWFKDGKPLQNQTGLTLDIDAAQPGDAGRYELRQTWPAGARVSETIPVGVYEPQTGKLPVRWDQPLSVTAKVWGPVEVRWPQYQGRESALFRGIRSPTLTITHGEAVAWTRIVAEVLVGGQTRTCVNLDVDVFGPPLLIAYGGLPEVWETGKKAQDYLSVRSRYPTPDTVISVDGLPPGVTVSPSGSITGNPTKAGSYTVTFKAVNAHGSATPLIWKVAVVPSANNKWPEGTYATLLTPSMLERTQLRDLQGGMITFRVEKRGTISGHVRLGPYRSGFAGKFPAAHRFRLPPIAGSKEGWVDIRPDFPSDSTWPILIADVYLGGKISTVQMPPALTWTPWPFARMMPGRYTVLLEPVDSGGSGFLTMVIDDALQATGVGTLADGTPITFASPLVLTDDGLQPGPVLAFSQAPGNMLIGHAGANLSEAAFPLIFPEQTFSGQLRWSRKSPRNPRIAGEFKNRAVNFAGARYFVQAPPLAPMTAQSVGPLNTRLELSGGGLHLASIGSPWQTLFTLQTGKPAVFPPPNATHLRFDLYSPTGFFTGTFTLDDLGPGANSRVRRIVQYRGMMAPGLNRGGGFFLLPMMPDPTATPPRTSANAPILSGKVTVTIPASP